MLKTALTLFAIAVASLPAAAQRPAPAPPSVAGTWTLAAETPHGNAAFGLVLKQEDKTVTGTFNTPHGEMPVTGEMKDGTLTLATTEEPAVTITAKLADDGTLNGYFSSEMGDTPFVGKRTPGRR